MKSPVVNAQEIVLTAEGYARIEKELEHLSRVERKAVADRIREAKDFGELTENAEYEEAKSEQALIEGRLLELRQILSHAVILREEDISTDHVGIGSYVRVRDLDTGEEWEFRMVSPFEADPDEDRISHESPIGEALMGHKVGDVVEVNIPAGKVRYQILDIHK
ncbi:MAG: transcription elongation factor GreA [bacterium]|nr:transcription elongation factor GreA [bacterium]MCS7310062.1 transcription elongation factor GreA [Armatimonadota bacterium]